MKTFFLLAAVTLAVLFSAGEAVNLECDMCEMSVKVVVPMLGQDTNDIKKVCNVHLTGDNLHFRPSTPSARRCSTPSHSEPRSARSLLTPSLTPSSTSSRTEPPRRMSAPSLTCARFSGFRYPPPVSLYTMNTSFIILPLIHVPPSFDCQCFIASLFFFLKNEKLRKRVDLKTKTNTTENAKATPHHMARSEILRSILFFTETVGRSKRVSVPSIS